MQQYVNRRNLVLDEKIARHGCTAVPSSSNYFFVSHQFHHVFFLLSLSSGEAKRGQHTAFLIILD